MNTHPITRRLVFTSLAFALGCSARTGLELPEGDDARCACDVGEVCVDGACECEAGLVRRGDGCEAPLSCDRHLSVDEPATFSLRHTLSIAPGGGLAAFAFDGRLYVAGSDSPDTGPFQSYDPTNGSVRDEVIPESNPFCACGYNGTPVVMDGVMFHFANDAWRFDGAWAPIPIDQSEKRGEAATAVFDGRIHLIGGRHFEDGSSEVLATTIAAYDPENGTFEIVGDVPFADSRYMAAATVGDHIYAIGASGFAAFDGASWTTLPSPEGTFDRSPMAAFDEKLVVIGWTNASAFSIFDPKLGVWSDERPLPDGVSSFTLAADGCDLWLVGQADDGARIYALD